ncbi:MAG: hypothetical protein DMG27_00615 [Acidobacteria bacterium]|nr:MAG: hypothetical protein DMG27_00615 [Acidobacteriota bacterium]
MRFPPVLHIRSRPRTRLTALSFCAVLICILAFSSSEISEAQGNVIDPGSAPSAGVRCWTESSATEVLPFETLLAAIYLMNESDQPRTVTEEWDVFQFVLGENGERTYYYPAGEPISPVSPDTSIVLNPREVKTWITYFDFFYDQHDKHVFTKPGIVRFATSLGSTRCGSMTISVTQPQGQDARAYEFLKQTDLVHYLANRAPDRWYEYNYQTVARLETFIQQFPDSRYKEYAELNLALMWKQGVEGKVDLAKATDLLTDLSKNGHDTMPARALYYLGDVAKQKGDWVLAQDYYQRAIEAKPDPYFRILTQEAWALPPGNLLLPKGVGCGTFPSAREVLPFETLWAAVYLKNWSNEPQTMTESLHLLQFVRRDAGGWRYYYPALTPISPPPSRELVVLQPGEARTWLISFDFDAIDKDPRLRFASVKHVLDRPGKVHLVVTLGGIRCGDMTISVTQPQGQDARAYELLKQTDLPHYFANEAPSRWDPYNYQNVARLEAFIRQFPDSRYRDYAELNLALMWKRGVEGKVNLAKATDLLTDLSNNGHDAMPARALYYLGEVAQQEGDVVRAKSYYQRAIEGKPDPYFRYIGEDKVRHLSAERKDHQHGH